MPVGDHLTATDPGNVFSVRSHVRDYEVEFDAGADWVQRLVDLENLFLVVDENVLRLHGDGVLAPLRDVPKTVLPISEEGKVIETVVDLCHTATQQAAKRNTTVVSIGGGITQDVTGFMASVLYRGVGWIYVPTTLLAMADSCIGSKTSLNLGSRKNLLGTIYPPNRVIVHAPFVDTLSGDDFASGVGEIVKLHMLGGASLTEGLRATLPDLMSRETSVVNDATRTSLEVKRDFIEEDEFDRGRRNLLNYGHCFGHALEAASDFAIPHGLAVVVGMRLADLLACRRGLLTRAEATVRWHTLYEPVLPSWPVLDAASRTALVGAMAYDKKRTGTGLAVIVVGEGLQPGRLSDVTGEEAHLALEELSVQRHAP
jgi:3-dehydroquinate synthase